MSSVVISGDTSGAITLSAPAVSGTNTITLPASTGTVMVNGPAFSVYPNATGSISNITPTKVACNTEDFDTNSCFDSTTNYRFTPTVAGYYQISGSVGVYGFSGASGQVVSYLYKNGSNYAQGARIPISGSSYEPQCPISVVMYLNGTTDYVELWAYQSSGVTGTIDTGRLYTYFTGSMIRGA